jgi:hypothetical protein
MEIDNFKQTDIKTKEETIRKIKNDIIGSFKMKSKYWQDGLIEILLNNMDDLEMSSELLIGSYSIFSCYTNNYEDAYDAFRYKEDFTDKIVDNLYKAIELNEDNRIIDLWMQIIRNMLVNDIISPEKAWTLNILEIFEKLADNNNKRINLIAQMLAKIARNSDEIKNRVLEQKTILDSIISWIEEKGSNNLRISILDCLISLSSNNDKITNYVRENINIQQLISMIKFQHNEINAKVAYLATILNSESNISGDFENLIKQIIFQITRMLQSNDIDEVLEATSMLNNLVKSNEGSDVDMVSGKTSLWIHTYEIGAVDILTKVLTQYINAYLEFIRNSSSPGMREENKKDQFKVPDWTKHDSNGIELKINDATDDFAKTAKVIQNILNIIKSLMNAYPVCLK